MKRVVVTGMSAITPMGSDWETVNQSLRSCVNSVKYIEEWDRIQGLRTRLAAPVEDFEVPEHYTRKKIRSMGRVSLFATRAAELALADSGLLDVPEIRDGQMGVSFGSSSGSPDALSDFVNLTITNSMEGITASTYIRAMAHTAAVNIGVFFGLTGRIITTSSACTSGSQGIGYAYEAIRFGKQKWMIAGGAEELSVAPAAVFDTLFATSTSNEAPTSTPRPFDKDRDGLVIGEGASALILEDYDHAIARGANIICEVVGFGTNSDGTHITQPNSETMQMAMTLALEDAEIAPEAIGYVNAHGTATDRGDVAESQATARLFGFKPLSCLKSYIGHTLGACGAIEAWATIHMMNDRWFAPNVNLAQVDDECGDLDYIIGEGRMIDTEYVMSNNFAFGGINTSLIFKKSAS